MKNKVRVAVMIGSESDLKQCRVGLLHLQILQNLEAIDFVGVNIGSIHRNTEAVLATIKTLVEQNVDVVIVGAGWANHLTGTVDAYLRYTLHDTKTHVLGVAFEDEKNSEHTQAAILSIIYVPGTQVDYCGVGSRGFYSACTKVNSDLKLLKVPEPRQSQWLTLEDAINQK